MSNLDDFRKYAKGSSVSLEKMSGTNCVAYTRVSTKEQEEGYSLETQRKAIEEYASKKGLTIVEAFGGTYESAKNDERKEFKRMLAFVRKFKGKISEILIYSLDRFSRSGPNSIHIISELRKQNIKVTAVTQLADTNTPSGKLQQNIHLIFSEFDNELRRQKCVAGMKEKLEQGYWPQKAPLGYDQYTNHKEQRITVNATGKILRKAFELKAEGKMNNVEIREFLKAAGVKVSIQQITEIFRNPFYCGILSHKLLEGKVVEGKHEKLISKELFQQINEDKKRQGIKFKKEFEETPLKHFLKCGTCGTPMTGYIKKGIPYYKCNKKGCKCNRNAKRLNGLFEKYLEGYRIPLQYLAPIREAFIRRAMNDRKRSEENEKLFKAQLNEINQNIDIVEEKYVLEKINEELYKKLIKKYKEEKEKIEGEIEKCQMDLSNLEKQVNKYLKLCLELPEIWEKSVYHDKKLIQDLTFPEGMDYDRENNNYRTTKTNSVIFETAQLYKDLKAYEKRKIADTGDFSNWVGPPGLEPGTLRL